MGWAGKADVEESFDVWLELLGVFFIVMVRVAGADVVKCLGLVILWFWLFGNSN